jgi:hypothetical protein
LNKENVRMKSFRFDLGDSNAGPIGMVLRVQARDARRAARLARRCLRLATGDCGDVQLLVPQELRHAVEYIHVYINPRRISQNDIDPADTEDSS